MRFSVVILLIAWITLVIGDASENLLNNTTALSDASIQEGLPALDFPSHRISEPQIAGTAVSLPEPASDQDWKTAVCKGTKMLAQMSYSDYDVGQLLPVPKDTVQSPWSKADLKKWGYNMYYAPPNYCDYSAGKYWGVSVLLQFMGFTDKCGKEPGQWKAVSINHEEDSGKERREQTYQDPSGKTRRVTGAHFYMSILEGVGIMAQNRISPWEALQELHPFDYASSEVPDLQRSSDMMWAMWEQFVPVGQRQDLEILITLSIINKRTLALISRALKNLGKELTYEPTLIRMGTDEGKALLSSPNAAGFAHFLIERKAQVGHKTIDVVLVFLSEAAVPGPCMAFGVSHIDVATPRPKDDTAPKDPKDEDPNNKDITKDPKPAPPGVLPPGDDHEQEITRRLTKQGYVRSHVFRLDERGNVTLSSSFR